MLPLTIWWVRHHEKIALRMGRKLGDEEMIWAIQIGIAHPEKVRILNVSRIPSPVPHFIEKLLQRRGYPTGNTAGMCMRYGIYTKETYAHKKSLIAHELVHTHQFERLGGLWHFLNLYLKETMILGYANSPLEIEANFTAESVLV
ncbi:MAG: hypothetical protein QMC23_06615 [Rubritalea sp.]